MYQMMRSNRLLLFASGMLVAIVLSIAAPVMAGGVEGFTGVFEGTGRACYGKLMIKAKTISWNTPFSTCKNVSYKIIEESNKGNEQHIVYVLKQRNKKCLFTAIELHHNDVSQPDLGWEVTGYMSVDDLKSDNIANSTSCYLVRLK